MSLLRDSFSGINSRFHLVGLYTLVDVFLTIVLSMAGDDPALGGVVVTVFILAWGVTFGILGLVYHAAAGREGSPSFPRYALSLFLPLFWLQLKLGVLTYGPAILVAWGYHKVTSPADVALETWMGRTLFWAEPFAALVVQILALYSTPMCILLRERNESGTPIRQGLRLLRACPQETVRLVGLIFIITVLVGTVHYLHGPDYEEIVPDIPEGIVLLATHYLSLVAFFGATRVVLGRLDLDPLRIPPPGRASSADEPPA